MKKLDKNKLIIIIFGILLLVFVGIIVKVLDKGEEDEPKISIINDSDVKVVSVSDEPYDDPNRTEISGEKMAKKHCFDGFCVSDVEILCYENSGVINYVIWNTTKSPKAAYLKITVDNFKGYIITEKLKPGKKFRGHIGYDGYDLRKTKDYKLLAMSKKEKNNVVE